MTSLLMAGASIEDISLALDWVFYIQYPVWFKNNKFGALINYGDKVNAMILTYIAKLDLKVY